MCGEGTGCAREETASKKSKQPDISANEERDIEASCPLSVLGPLMGLRGSGTRLRVIVLIIPLYGAKNLAKKPFLLLVRVFGGTSYYRRGTNCIVSGDGPLRGGRGYHRRRRRRLGAQTEELLEEVTLVRGN